MTKPKYYANLLLLFEDAIKHFQFKQKLKEGIYLYSTTLTNEVQKRYRQKLRMIPTMIEEDRSGEHSSKATHKKPELSSEKPMLKYRNKPLTFNFNPEHKDRDKPLYLQNYCRKPQIQ